MIAHKQCKQNLHSYNPYRTTSGEGALLERIRRWGAKAGGAKGIRYPRSPSCKRYPLDVGYPTRVSSVTGKPLSGSPGEYGRKTET